LLFSCNEENEDKKSGSETQNGTVIVVPAGGSGTNRLSAIPISFLNSQQATNVFSLVDATAFTIELADCLSGYTAIVTEANIDGLEIYNYDRECKAKLTQFSANGRNYVPTSGDPFTTWQAGDSAIFDEVGEPGIFPLKIVVLSTLGDPATSSDKITYGWATIAEGSTNAILWSTIGASGDVQHLTNLPPSFSIRSIEFLGLTAGEGGQYRLVLECTVTIGITNVCSSVDLADLDYKLVEDTYGGTIDKAAGDAIFSTPGTPVTLPGERVAPGDSGTTKGGFVSVILDGPDNLASKPNMLYVIRSYGESYQYFNLDITVSTNF
jgi:hypothetical protein